MAKKIALVLGHPDPESQHLGYALAESYRQGALAAGHEVREIRVADLDFPLLRSKRDFDKGAPVPDIQAAQNTLAWADHWVLIYPLWLGTLPALFKGFLEQVFRPGFAFAQTKPGTLGTKLLKGKTAHIVVTMGMPAFAYRWFYRAHGLKSLEQNILAFSGIKTVRRSLLGMVEGKAARREKWLARMQQLGGAA